MSTGAFYPIAIYIQKFEWNPRQKSPTDYYGLKSVLYNQMYWWEILLAFEDCVNDTPLRNYIFREIWISILYSCSMKKFITELQNTFDIVIS